MYAVYGGFGSASKELDVVLHSGVILQVWFFLGFMGRFVLRLPNTKRSSAFFF